MGQSKSRSTRKSPDAEWIKVAYGTTRGRKYQLARRIVGSDSYRVVATFTDEQAIDGVLTALFALVPVWESA